MPSALLTRLLLVITPVWVTGCDGLGPRVQLPGPPLRPTQAVPPASATAAQPGDQAMALCGPEYRSRPLGRTGGPYGRSFCYQPVAPATGCLPATGPALRRSLHTEGDCVYDGPHAQTDPATGGPWCCYNLGFMGEGRPLLVAGARRHAALTAHARWA